MKRWAVLLIGLLFVLFAASTAAQDPTPPPAETPTLSPTETPLPTEGAFHFGASYLNI